MTVAQNLAFEEPVQRAAATGLPVSVLFPGSPYRGAYVYGGKAHQQLNRTVLRPAVLRYAPF
jgi:hypothetical protein